jgi:hypothetical protein
MKAKELGWKETQGIQNIGIEDSQVDRIVDQRKVLKIWKNDVTELYERTNRPGYLLFLMYVQFVGYKLFMFVSCRKDVQY